VSPSMSTDKLSWGGISIVEFVKSNKQAILAQLVLLAKPVYFYQQGNLKQCWIS